MEIQDLVDAELLFIDHVKADADVAAFWASGETISVSTDVPSSIVQGEDTDLPHIRIARQGGLPVNRNRVPDRARLQIETWAATRADAFDLMGAVAKAVYRAIDATHAAGLVYDVREDLAVTWRPDPETDHPRWVMGINAFIRAKT